MLEFEPGRSWLADRLQEIGLTAYLDEVWRERTREQDKKYGCVAHSRDGWPYCPLEHQTPSVVAALADLGAVVNIASRR